MAAPRLPRAPLFVKWAMRLEELTEEEVPAHAAEVPPIARGDAWDAEGIALLELFALRHRQLDDQGKLLAGLRHAKATPSDLDPRIGLLVAMAGHSRFPHNKQPQVQEAVDSLKSGSEEAIQRAAAVQAVLLASFIKSDSVVRRPSLASTNRPIRNVQI